MFNIRGFIFPLPTKLRFFSLHFFFKITLTSFPFLSYLSFRTVNPDFWGRLSHDAIVSYQEIHLPNIHSVMFHRFCCGNRIWTDWHDLLILQFSIQPSTFLIIETLRMRVFFTTLFFNCMLLSCHPRVSQWSTLYSLPECQGTPCLKQVPYLKFNWQKRDSNPQPLTS